MDETEVRTAVLSDLRRLGLYSARASVNCLGGDPSRLVDRVVVYFDGEIASGSPNRICLAFRQSSNKVELIDILERENLLRLETDTVRGEPCAPESSSMSWAVVAQLLGPGDFGRSPLKEPR